MKKYKIKIVASNFNKKITDYLIEGAKIQSEIKSVDNCEIVVDCIFVPGAFEIPSMVSQIINKDIDRNEYNGILTLGSVIKGETAHFEYISSAVIDTLSKLTISSHIPIALGILTCFDYSQALHRALPVKDGGLNKGGEVMSALLQTINEWEKINRR